MRKNKEEEIEIGSVVKIDDGDKIIVGEVSGIIKGRKDAYEIILYDKRFKPIMRGDGTFRRKRYLTDKCTIMDEGFKFNNETIELGDIVCKKTNGLRDRYGVVIGFTHPDGLFSTSYANGYNGTDMIDCVEINKRGLSRCRDAEGQLKRFSTFNERVSSCEVDLWNRSGPKIVSKS